MVHKKTPSDMLESFAIHIKKGEMSPSSNALPLATGGHKTRPYDFRGIPGMVFTSNR